MTLLFLLRHGEIDWPEADCFMGQTDPPLSPEGRRQARFWCNELQKAALAAVWSSDLKRAAETATLLFSGRGPDVRPCRDLREIHLGQWDGVPRRRIRDDHPELWQARGNDLAGFRPPGGESFRDLRNRVVPRVTRIAAETAGAACIIAHAGVIRVLICHWLQMPLANLFRIRLDYGSLSIVSWRPEHIEVRALNLRPAADNHFSPEGDIGGQHDPAPVRVS